MKLKLAGVGTFLGMAMILGAASGCGPGLSHRTVNAQDVLAEMDRELASSIPGTATLTSAPMDLPSERLPLSALDEAMATEPAANPPAQTWGTAPPPREIDTKSPYDPN